MDGENEGKDVTSCSASGNVDVEGMMQYLAAIVDVGHGPEQLEEFLLDREACEALASSGALYVALAGTKESPKQVQLPIYPVGGADWVNFAEFWHWVGALIHPNGVPASWRPGDADAISLVRTSIVPHRQNNTVKADFVRCRQAAVVCCSDHQPTAPIPYEWFWARCALIVVSHLIRYRPIR